MYHNTGGRKYMRIHLSIYIPQALCIWGNYVYGTGNTWINTLQMQGSWCTSWSGAVKKSQSNTVCAQVIPRLNFRGSRIFIMFAGFIIADAWVTHIVLHMCTLPQPSASVERDGRFVAVLAAPATENKQDSKVGPIALLDLKLWTKQCSWSLFTRINER